MSTTSAVSTANSINGGKRKSLKSNIQTTLQKWKSAFKRITEETINNLDENDIPASADRKIEALFNPHGDQKKSPRFKGSEKYQLTRPNNNETSLINASISTPPTTAGNGEMKITDVDTTCSSNVGASNHYSPNPRNKIDRDKNIVNSNNEKITFDLYDAVKECRRLRNQADEPFCQADIIWKTRRKLWTDVTTNKDANEQHNREVFGAIPEQYYYRVYKKLVVDDKPLREPLNLEDAMKVINSGWTETKKWDNAAKGLG